MDVTQCTPTHAFMQTDAELPDASGINLSTTTPRSGRIRPNPMATWPTLTRTYAHLPAKVSTLSHIVLIRKLRITRLKGALGFATRPDPVGSERTPRGVRSLNDEEFREEILRVLTCDLKFQCRHISSSIAGHDRRRDGASVSARRSVFFLNERSKQVIRCMKIHTTLRFQLTNLARYLGMICSLPNRFREQSNASSDR